MTLNMLTLQLYFSIAVISVLILRFFMKKMPKIYSYLLWIIVFARLLFPFSLELEHAVMPQTDFISGIIQMETTPTATISTDTSTISADTPTPSTDTPTPSTDTLNASTSNPSENKSNTSSALLVIIWISGASLLLIYNGFSTQRVRNSLKDARHLKENIYITDKFDTPFTIGIWHPYIYLPSFLSKEEQEYILCHEQIHIKRKDNLIKWLTFLLTCIHWFNPFCWIAFHFMEEDMEMSCDEAVINRLGESIKKNYSQSLLDFASDLKRPAFTPFGEIGIKQRIQNILTKKDYGKKMKYLGILTIFIVALCIFTSTKASPSTQLETFVNNWATAFCEKDSAYLIEHMGNDVKKSYRASGLLEITDNKIALGFENIWPTGEVPYKIQYVELDDNNVGHAIIYYYALSSDPRITVWKETLTLHQTEDKTYQVTKSDFSYFFAISSLDEFCTAYSNGYINDTGMDYSTNGLGEQLNTHALDGYTQGYIHMSDLFNPVSAARTLLRLEDTQTADISILETLNDGSVILEIQFRSGQKIYIKMIQPYGNNGIWIPQTADEYLD